MNRATADVVIVGAGIVGAACAAALSAEGLSVIVVESRGVGEGATAAGMGHLVVMDDSEAQFALTRYSLSLWNELVDPMPADVELDRCGTLWVAADEPEMEAVRQKHRFYGERGVQTQILDERQVAEAEPNLRPELAGGLRVPGDCVLYPPTAARYLLERSRARIVRGEVVSLRGGGVELADRSRISGRYAVNSAGNAAGRLTSGIDVWPRKGHLVITDRYPGFVRHQLIELGYLKSAHESSNESVAFNIQPRKTGQLLIGSSRQYGSDDPAIDHGILSRMIARALEYMPGLAKLSAIRAWAGFRPSTPDKLPLIGPAMEDERVILATGHEGMGITTAMGTGRLVADLIVGRESEIDPSPYLPARFAAGVAHG
jgi:glycine/D-amino acid oxidase-like deaminating enzyme